MTDTQAADGNVEKRPLLASREPPSDSDGTRVTVGPDSIGQKSVGVMLVLVSSLVVSQTLNYVLNIRLATHMKSYTWFLVAIAINVFFLVMVLPVTWYKLVFTKDITPAMRQVRWQYFAWLGLLDGVGNLIGTIPAPYVSGPVQVVISQTLIPINMLCSAMLLRTRYSTTHYIGVALIFGGVFVSVASSLSSSGTPWYWLVMLVLSNVPYALSNVYKERGLKNQDLDVWYLNSWVSTFQLLLCFVTIPTVFLPIVNGREEGALAPSEFGTYLHHATLCLFGSDPPDAHVSPLGATSSCGVVPGVFTAYMLINLLFNILLLLTFKHGSATLAVVASAVRVPLSAFGFSWPALAGPAYRAVRIEDVIALCVLMAGLAVYQWKKETKEEAPDPAVDGKQE